MSQIYLYLTSIFLNFIIYIYHSKLNILYIPYDVPDNLRKFHKKPILISGGLIMFINFIFLNLYSLWLGDSIFLNLFDSILSHVYFFILLTFSYFLGLYDDKKNIGPLVKLFILSLIIIFLLLTNEIFIITEIKVSFTNHTLNLNYFSIPFTLLCFLLFINSINMFDGINLQSSTFLLTILIYFFIKGLFSTLIVLVIIPLLLFIILNYKNKSFLGDGGCFILSILIGTLCIASYNLNYIKFTDDIFLLMILPGIDMLRLFFVRIINKKNPLKPDRNHIHHVLEKNIGFKKTISLLIFLNYGILLLILMEINNLIILSLLLIIYFGFLIKYSNVKLKY